MSWLGEVVVGRVGGVGYKEATGACCFCSEPTPYSSTTTTLQLCHLQTPRAAFDWISRELMRQAWRTALCCGNLLSYLNSPFVSVTRVPLWSYKVGPPPSQPLWKPGQSSGCCGCYCCCFWTPNDSGFSSQLNCFCQWGLVDWWCWMKGVFTLRGKIRVQLTAYVFKQSYPNNTISCKAKYMCILI